jgi:isoleucyl-tRNA synthetase
MTRPTQLAIEKASLKYWQDENAFQRSNDVRQGTPFIAYEGPPFATGKPHFGHILVSVLKDVVARYQNMNGHPVPRKFGWDCHGLPIESIAQKEMGMTAGEVLRNNKVKEFNTKCRSLVNKCERDWEGTIERIGRWVDFQSPYRTMDIDYMESVWWAFKSIYNQNRIYKAHRIMAYSGKLMTPLSNFEVSDNYREIEDYFAVPEFRAKAFDFEFSIIAYTTTPWTLPSNVALCVHPAYQYSIVEDTDTYEKWLVASSRIPAYFAKRDIRILKTVKGTDLVGVKYKPLFSIPNDERDADNQHLHTVVADSYVSETEGTGVVHIAPAFGEDDYRIGKVYSLPMRDYLDAECKFGSQIDSITPYNGIFCKDADGVIVSELSSQLKLFSSGKIKHNYPFCDRTDSPIIYRAIDAWYLKLEDIKERLLANNAKINWVPDHIGKNRFANWLKEAKDWNISRNRLWGSCIPLWVAEDGETICVGSVNELETLSGHRITDLHKDNLDTIRIVKGGKTFTRVPEVLDCWFESGAMPFAQFHFPFENKELFNRSFPADFVVEGLDQTRGWFYTLLVLSTILFNEPPFRNVIVNGLLLAEDGSKMSKSKSNYSDPTVVMDKYGADALRMYLCSTPATHAEPVAFKEHDLETIQKQVILPFLNALDFFELYSKIDKWDEAERAVPCERKLDAWLMDRLDMLIGEVRGDMDKFEIWKVVPKFAEFMDDLCNWYIRLSRKVFWGASSPEKSSAYQTLYSVLTDLSKLLAPFIPFTADYVFGALRQIGSVHLKVYPRTLTHSRDRVEEMELVRKVVNMGRKLRARAQIKTRQPLSSITIYGANLRGEDLPLVREELNVQSVDLRSMRDVPIKYEWMANCRTIGAKFGKDSQSVFAIVKDKFTLEHIRHLESGHPVVYDGLEIKPEDVVITKRIDMNGSFSSEDGITVSLNTTLTPELMELGFVSEFRSLVQGMRKTGGLVLSDRIYMEVWAGNDACEILAHHKKSLMEQLLSTDIRLFAPNDIPLDEVHKAQIDNEKLYVRLFKEESANSAA